MLAGVHGGYFRSNVLINTALTSLALHLMGTGNDFLICLVAMMKLPTPDKDLLKKVLGEEVKCRSSG